MSHTCRRFPSEQRVQMDSKHLPYKQLFSALGEWFGLQPSLIPRSTTPHPSDTMSCIQ